MFPYCISLMTPKEKSNPFALLRPASNLGCRYSSAALSAHRLASGFSPSDTHLSNCLLLPSVLSEFQSSNVYHLHWSAGQACSLNGLPTVLDFLWNGLLYALIAAGVSIQSRIILLEDYQDVYEITRCLALNSAYTLSMNTWMVAAVFSLRDYKPIRKRLKAGRCHKKTSAPIASR